MINLMEMLINLPIFLLVSSLIFYVLGFLFLVKEEKELERYEFISIAYSLGIIIFVFLAFVFSLLHLRVLVLPLLIMITVFTYLKYKSQLFAPWKILLKDKILTVLLFLGILIQGFINFPSGFIYGGEMLFWSSQGHDGLWHVALMEEITKNIPPQNPIFAGEKLYNYHYLIDVVMGEFHRIFPLFSSLDLYFRFFPIIFSFLIGISIFSLLSRWKNNHRIGYLGLIFTYFVGSFGYIVTFLRNGTLFGGETVFWAAQQNTILGNPPHAVSHFLLTTLFLTFLLYTRSRKKIWLFYTFILGFLLAGFKVSGGFVMLVGIVVACLIDFINYRKISSLILAMALSISNFVTFKSMTSPNASSFLMFLPWWFVRTMIVVKLGWLDIELKRQHYISKGTWHAWLRVIQLESMAFLIFVVGNLGMRIIGIYGIIRSLWKEKIHKNTFEIALIITMVTGLIMPLLFVQKGIIYNNIQFMQYFLLIFGFYGAISFYSLLSALKNKLLKIAAFIILICFSSPTVIGNLNEFYGSNRPALAKISKLNLEALDFIKKNSNPEDIILTLPFDKNLKNKYNIEPRPIYAWYSTPYIAALTGRLTYLTAEEQVLITGYPKDERLEKINKFFSQTDFNFNNSFLKDGGIKYIYIEKPVAKSSLETQKNNITQVFDNNEVVIYKIN